MMGGISIFVVETWARGFAWRVLRAGRHVPAKAAGRRGTRRAWKRRHPQGIRWRFGPVEPDHAIRTPDAIYCTARQAEMIRKAAA